MIYPDFIEIREIRRFFLKIPIPGVRKSTTTTFDSNRVLMRAIKQLQFQNSQKKFFFENF